MPIFMCTLCGNHRRTTRKVSNGDLLQQIVKYKIENGRTDETKEFDKICNACRHRVREKRPTIPTSELMPIQNLETNLESSSASSIPINSSPPGRAQTNSIHFRTMWRTIRNKDREINDLKKQIKVLKRKIRRREEKEAKQLQKQQNVLIYPDNPVLKELVIRSNISNKNSKFSETLKQFALQLNYYSPRAYNFVRAKLGDLLPYPKIFCMWTKHINTEPGFNTMVQKELSTRNRNSNIKLYYSLAIDEIHLKKQYVNDKLKIKGNVDYGNLDVAPKSEMASAGLFIMANQINGKLKVPIGYFLTNGCSGELLEKVIIESLRFMHQSGSHVITIAFDGLPANLNAAERLGANLNINSPMFQPFMMHPETGTKVYFYPDPAHMIKLFRNVLNSKEVFIDKDGNFIRWDLINTLQHFQANEGVRAANKLTIRHTNFHQEKMKVKLAVQVFSQSVAVALTVCEKLNIPGFADTAPTVKFLKIMDRTFDILNSFAKGENYKAPISRTNCEEIQAFISMAKQYFFAIRIKVLNKDKITYMWKRLSETNSGTCVTGLYVSLTIIDMLISERILGPNPSFKYIPTYKLGSDCLELFFSSLRARFGQNNNPNCVELEHGLKRILMSKIDPNVKSNCTPQDDTETIHLSSTQLLTNKESEIENLELETEECHLSIFVQNVAAYLAGFIGKKISPLLNCFICAKSLWAQEFENYNTYRSDFVLLNEKNNGGLFIPSDSLVNACKLIEQRIRELKVAGIANLNYNKLEKLCMRSILDEEIFKDLRTDCDEDHPLFCDHPNILMKSIIKLYSKYRLNFLCKEETLQKNPRALRHNLTHAILFGGQ